MQIALHSRCRPGVVRCFPIGKLDFIFSFVATRHKGLRRDPSAIPPWAGQILSGLALRLPHAREVQVGVAALGVQRNGLVEGARRAQDSVRQ